MREIGAAEGLLSQATPYRRVSGGGGDQAPLVSPHKLGRRGRRRSVTLTHLSLAILTGRWQLPTSVRASNRGRICHAYLLNCTASLTRSLPAHRATVRSQVALRFQVRVRALALAGFTDSEQSSWTGGRPPMSESEPTSVRGTFDTGQEQLAQCMPLHVFSDTIPQSQTSLRLFLACTAVEQATRVPPSALLVRGTGIKHLVT